MRPSTAALIRLSSRCPADVLAVVEISVNERRDQGRRSRGKAMSLRESLCERCHGVEALLVDVQTVREARQSGRRISGDRDHALLKGYSEVYSMSVAPFNELFADAISASAIQSLGVFHDGPLGILW
jgi:hypothetical protein